MTRKLIYGGIVGWFLYSVFTRVILAENICELSDKQSLNRECNDCKVKWTDLLETLTSGNQKEFKRAIWPFANATKNTYTWRLEEPVHGWTLIRERNPVNGMHALAYQNDLDKTLVMIGVRGTQLGGTTIESQNDICADWWLLDRDEPPYEFCDKFTMDQMNYLQQLLEFVHEVDQVVLPLSTCKIYTGHSLGSLLSSLASTHSYAEDPAVTFGPPGPRTAAMWLKLPSPYWSHNVYSFYSQYDPVAVLPESLGNQTGTICELGEESEPDQCVKCFANPQFDITNMTSPCGECFSEMHTYGHYLDLLFDLNAPRSCQRVLTAASGARSALQTFNILGATQDSTFLIFSVILALMH